MKSRLNLKRSVLLLLGCALLITGWYCLHRYQRNRLVGELLHQSKRAEAEGHPERAARMLRQYLSLTPENTDARAQYGILLEKLATTPRARQDALSVYQEVLKQEAFRDDICRRAIDLAIQLGKFKVALGYLTQLRARHPNDPELHLLVAGCLESTGDYQGAEASCRACLTQTPQRVEVYVALAHLNRNRLDRPAEADRLMNEMIERNATSAAAFLARAQYRRSFQKEAGIVLAEQDLKEARRLAPNELAILLASAQLCTDQARGEGTETLAVREQARGYLRHGLRINPKDARSYEALAALEIQAGKPAEALACLREGRKQVPVKAQQRLLCQLFDLLLNQDLQVEAQDVFGQLKKYKLISPEQLACLQGALWVKEGKWTEAITLLETKRPLLTDSLALVIQTDLLLAVCYGRLGDADRQLATYRRAGRLDPLHAEVRLGTAAALASLGRLDEAIEEYKRAVGLPSVPVSAWLNLGRLLILRNLSRDPGIRQWEEVENVLRVAERAMPDSADVSVLRAEVLVAQGKLDDAKSLLEKQRDLRPKVVAFWVALAGLAERIGKPEDAARILTQAEEQIGDRVELRLARVRFLPLQEKATAARTLALLTQGAERFEARDRALLLQEIAHAYALLGDISAARTTWENLALVLPNNLRPRLVLFDLALQANDEAVMKRLLDEIRQIEGANGPLARYGEASHLVWRARRGELNVIPQARTALTAAAARRPGWSRIPLMLAAIDEMEGNYERAIENYRRAVELGDRQINVVRRLVELLFERHRYTDADEAMRRLQEQAPISNELRKLAAEISLRNLDSDRALYMAREAVSTESKDYRDHLWLGQVMCAVGKRSEGEKELRKAIALAGELAHPWVVLIQCQARARDTKAAAATLEEARTVIRPEKYPLAMAQCFEAIGQIERATAEYQQALKRKPDDLEVLHSTAQFYQRIGRPREAEPLLRRLLEEKRHVSNETRVWARRNLALVIGVTGNGEQSKQALKMLEENARDGKEQVEDQRARAVILATHLESRTQAIELLEKAARTQALKAEEEFLLARLYEGKGEWGKARAQMLHLLGAQKDSPRSAAFIAAFVGSLLRRGEVGEAKLWTDQLVRLEPNSFTTVALQARLAAEGGRGEEAVKLAREYTAHKPANTAVAANRLHQAAGLLESLGHEYPAVRTEAFAGAERLYGEFVTTSEQPERFLIGAGFYGRLGKVELALDWCEKATGKSSAEEIAVAAVTVVCSAAATPLQLQRVNGLIEAAMQKTPRQLNLLVYLAALRERQGRYEDAEQLCRKVLEQDGSNVLALNNLANLLALRQTKLDEALRFVERATTVAGADAELLDTRALVRIAQQDGALATQDLQSALSQKRTPTRLFHLAQAYLVIKKEAEARQAFREAKKLGLTEGKLHPLEVEGYQKLTKRLERD